MKEDNPEELLLIEAEESNPKIPSNTVKEIDTVAVVDNHTTNHYLTVNPAEVVDVTYLWLKSGVTIDTFYVTLYQKFKAIDKFLDTLKVNSGIIDYISSFYPTSTLYDNFHCNKYYFLLIVLK